MRRDERIRQVMEPGAWYTTGEIAKLTGLDLCLVSGTLYKMKKYGEVDQAISVSDNRSGWRLREAERWITFATRVVAAAFGPSNN